jgi:hypothetical protein
MSADTTAKALRFNASGEAQVDDADRDRDLVSTWSDIIPTDSLRATGDSSNVIQLGGARHLILLLKGCPKGPHGQAFSNVAIQIRTHINSQSDSNSTVPIYQMTSSNGGIAIAAAGDTAAIGHLAAGTATLAWSGETTVRFDRARCGPNGSTSATLFYPSGIGIPLDGMFGRDLVLANISVRARVIGGPSVLDFTATLIGMGK